MNSWPDPNHPKVLIVDLTAEASPGLSHLLDRAGCRVDVFSPKVFPWLKNKYCARWWEAGSHEPEAFVADLQALLDSQNYDWIVPANDLTVRTLNKTVRSDPLARKILPLTRTENRMILGSKVGLSLLCERHGLLTPRFAVDDGSLTPREMSGKTGFPLLLKVDESAGGRGVFYCVDHQTVEDILCRLTAPQKKNLIFQEYIAGETVAVEALYKQGRLLGYVYAIVTRTLSGEFGVSSERCYRECPEIEETLNRMGTSWGIHGFSTMTFILEKSSGKHYLVEADLRPQGWFRYAVFGGLDFSRVIQNYFSPGALMMRPSLPAGHSQIVVRRFLRDIRACFQQRDFGGLMLWLTNGDGRWHTVTRPSRATLIWFCHRAARRAFYFLTRQRAAG